MAAWPPVGGGRMVSTVNTITPWASPEATLAVTSFHIVHRPWRLSAVSREASRSLLEVSWRHFAEDREVVPTDGGRGVRWSESSRASVPVHEGERLGCTITPRSRLACVLAARDQLSISSPVSRRQTRHVRHASGM